MQLSALSEQIASEMGGKRASAEVLTDVQFEVKKYQRSDTELSNFSTAPSSPRGEISHTFLNVVENLLQAAQLEGTKQALSSSFGRGGAKENEHKPTASGGISVAELTDSPSSSSSSIHSWSRWSNDTKENLVDRESPNLESVKNFTVESLIKKEEQPWQTLKASTQENSNSIPSLALQGLKQTAISSMPTSSAGGNANLLPGCGAVKGGMVGFSLGQERSDAVGMKADGTSGHFSMPGAQPLSSDRPKHQNEAANAPTGAAMASSKLPDAVDISFVSPAARHSKYCHFCQHIKNTMVACATAQCTFKFCHHCISVHLHEDWDLVVQESRNNTWKCPCCRHKCCCCSTRACMVRHPHCKAYRKRLQARFFPQFFPA